MDIWEILGIEETFDKTEIKRAYARKAKLYHPEEHPKEYQRLRSAYRMAVKLAEESKKAMEIDAGVPVGEDETRSHPRGRILIIMKRSLRMFQRRTKSSFFWSLSY